MSTDAALAGPGGPPPRAASAGFDRAFLVTLGAWVIFGIVNAAIRSYPGASLAAADALSMVAAQQLRVAYQVGQPPLYDWLLWLLQQATGPTLLSAYVLKYALTLVLGMTVFAAASRIARSTLVGCLASLSLMALFNVGFTIHDQSTHSVAMIAAMGVTLLAFVKVAELGRRRDYALLGVGIAAGLLSKYGFVIFPAALTLAFLSSTTLRPRILTPRLLIALAIPLATVGPFLEWLHSNQSQFAAKLDQTLLDDMPGWQMESSFRGIALLLGSFAAYAAPAVPLLWLVWPRLPGRWPTRLDVQRGDLRAALGLALLIGFAAALATMVAVDGDTMRSRYMHVLGLMLPVYVALFLEPEEARLRGPLFLAIVAILQAGQAGVRVATHFAPAWPFCQRCGVVEPLDALGREIEARGYGAASIHAPDPRIGGNLRVMLPRARIATPRLAGPTARGAPMPDGTRCLQVEALVNGGTVAGETVTIRWPRPLSGPERTTRYALTPLPATDLRCR